MTTIQDMHAAVDAAAQDHFDWCSDHDYMDPEPRTQLCRAKFELDFTGSRESDRDNVTAITVELAGSEADVDYGHPVPQATIGFNGQFGERDIQPWKLTPIAYLLLAAQARAEGDPERARAFEDAANTAITQHYTETSEDEPGYYVASPAPAGAWFNEPKYVMGSDPDDGIITIDEYRVRGSVAAGVPQYVVQHTTDGRFQVVGARDSKPVDGETYGEFADAKAVRDRLNEQAREQAAAGAR